MLETTVRHALDPLSVEEIATAVRVIRAERNLTGPHRFNLVTLAEPAKSVPASSNGHRSRQAFAVVLDGVERAGHEAVVSLTDERLLSWTRIETGQPPILLSEFLACEQAVRADPGFQAAMRRRGVEDMSLVWVDPWSTGHYPGQENDRRLSRALIWVKNDPDDDNGYAHPVENLAVTVDLHEQKVVAIEDGGVVPIPRQTGNYRPGDVGPPRPGLKPLEIVQPEGPSFEVDGYAVRWQNWRFRVGFTPREGLVLHEVGWDSDGRVRPILYRASVSEMVVPYGDPGLAHRKKNAFDVGEYNIGALANSLTLGCDCLGLIRYFDAALVSDDGTPYVLENAVCMHEEDYGVLWRHWNWRTDEAEIRRSRRLVVSFWSTVGNYDYGFFWYLYQDGRIEAEVKLTGIVSTGAVPPGVVPRYGQRLNADGLYAPIHQHFFSYRLDFDVDGARNTVLEEHAEPDSAGDHNPLDAGYFMVSTRLERESEAQQLCDPARARTWKIINPDSLNAVGEPVAYRLTPHGNVLPFAASSAGVVARATFATKHLWVTPYEPTERFAAGDYPNQHPGGAGLPEWTSADRAIAETDVVLWYTLGVHHQARLEDWPVMPCGYAGFSLTPSGFFDQNPALDVPAPTPTHSPNGHCH
jgi:primary-amine oxidase